MATTTEGTRVSGFCTECGKPNAETSRFCFSCGGALSRGLTPTVAIGDSQNVPIARAVVVARSVTPELHRFDKMFMYACAWIFCLVYVALLATALGPNITFLHAVLSATVVAWSFVLYCLPTLLAIIRAKSNRMAISAINLLLGWTLIGWVALSWALTKENSGAHC
jgi:hypothetical protein